MKHPERAFLTLRAVRRGLQVTSAACMFVAVGGAYAAVYYVDGNCPVDGNGAAVACASTSGAPGPKRTIDSGIALLTGPGDVLNIRGVHTAHNGELRDFDGRYHTDRYTITGKQGASGSPMIIQPYGYTGPASGEAVYIDGTTAPSSGWTQCTNCASGVCAGVPGTCGETWYATDTGAANLVLGAQRPNGAPTYRVTSPSDLTNNHAGYAGASTEIDSYSPQNGGPILVRWGQGTNAPLGTNNPKPYVYYNNRGDGILITNSKYLTVRGLTVRCHRRNGIVLIDSGGPVINVTIIDNRLLFNVDAIGNGSDYGMAASGVTSATIENNEIAWTGSEGIHTEAVTGGSALIVRGNWIHGQGDHNVLGQAISGTPNGIIFGEKGGFQGPGDYTGSIAENNLIEDQKRTTGVPGGTVGRGIILENNSNNWIIRNNIFRRVAAVCLKMDAKGITVNNNQIYNNLFIECGQDPGGEAGDAAAIYAYVGSTNSLNNNLIYNNTFVNNRDGAVRVDCGGTCTGNVFRNNIMYDSGSKQLVSWSPSGTFTNNLVYSTSTGTLVSFNGRNWTCSALVATADVDGDGAANDSVRCLPPLFVPSSGYDFHLAPGSPAINLGTTLGMPVGRTRSINNTLAFAHGLPSYADNSAIMGSLWDAGATEFGGSAGPTATITLSAPSPIGAGNVTVSLSTSVPVINVPSPLTLLEFDSSTTLVNLTGRVPGSVFTGLLVVDSTVADGTSNFVLPPGSLVDSSGNQGNQIVSGAQVTIDKPPSPPQNLRSSN